jgi:hypothetical protein
MSPKPCITREPDRIRLRQAMRELTPGPLCIWMLLHERDLSRPTSAPALARVWGLTTDRVRDAIAILDRVGFVSAETNIRTKKTLYTLKIRLDVSTGAYLRHGSTS